MTTKVYTHTYCFECSECTIMVHLLERKQGYITQTERDERWLWHARQLHCTCGAPMIIEYVGRNQAWAWSSVERAQ